MFISFSIFAFITSIWALSNLFFELNHSLLSLKCQYAFGSLVMVFGLLWVERLVGSNKKIKEVFYVIFGAILFAIPFIDGLVVRDVYATGGSFGFEKGAIFDIYSTIANLIFLYLIYALISGFRRSKGLKRTQLTFVITGAVLFSTISIFYSFVLPFFGFHPVAPVDAISSLFLVGFSSYAIIKHRFLDIRMVVARSVAYAILLLILGGFYGAAIFTAQALIFPSASYSTGYVALQITLALIMAFSFQPLRRWLTRVTDKIFFKNAYDPEALLDDVSHTVGSTIVLIEMMYKTLQLLSKEMKVTRGIIVVLTESGAIYNSQSINYKNALEIKDTDMVKLAKDGILIYDELEESSHYKRLLRKYDVSVSVPIKTNTDTVGVLLLGEKASGDMYSQTDHKIFEIIAPELAVAITNAKSFEKIEKFNVTLRQEIKKATHELEKKNDQLRELDKAKDEFISMASHQLRTPLTAIKGYLSMLLEGDAGEIKVSQYDFVNEAYQGANRMVGLINDLLNVSRMETGRFFLEPTEVNMEKVAEEEVKQLLNHAKEKKLKLSLKIKGKTPHVMVDETKIRQVMMNFIDNAVYYTTEGSVTVTLEHDKNDVIFKVTDTGIGVPKEAQKNLFTKFYRADNARHVRPDGTGLGIYLAKRVMDDHHGELIFHSEEGKGSVFGFKLPIKSKIKMQPVTAPAPTGQTVGPAIGELAAGIGVPAETLEATQVKCGPTVTPNSAIANGDVIASKAAGLETPLPKVK
jgi:signal transduction histidine kinase